MLDNMVLFLNNFMVYIYHKQKIIITYDKTNFDLTIIKRGFIWCEEMQNL
jgi:hypothetical protein